MANKKNADKLKDKLTPEQYRVMCEQGTELPFTGKWLKEKGTGMYVCAACGAELFSSETKYDSGSGWPSFWDAAGKNIELRPDTSLGMTRTEVICKKCGSHLGHLFDDGPKPTGKRYCVNSVALDFKAKENGR